MTGEDDMSHEAALDAICGCARTVTVLSYQEAVEGYLSLRGITPETDYALLQSKLDRATEALEKIATVDMGGGFLGAQACRKIAIATLSFIKEQQ